MNTGGVWNGIKSVILILERVDALAARLDETCTKIEALAGRVVDVKVSQATIDNEFKHVDSKITAAAILATDRLNRELLDRIADLERRLDEVQGAAKKRRQPAGLLSEPKTRHALVPRKQKDNVRR